MVLFNIITFFITILALFAIIILFIRQNRVLELEKKYEQLNDELEDVLASFFEQMKEENDTFLKKIQTIQNEKNAAQTIADNTSNFPNQNNHSNMGKINIPYVSGIKEYKKSQSTPVLEQTERVQTENNDTKTVLSKHEQELKGIEELLLQGKSIEQIAKQLNKGKTEVELLIKFSPHLNKRK